MSSDSRFFPTLAMPIGTSGQVLTKNSADPDNGAQWADPQVGIGPQGPQGPQGPVGPPGAAGTPGTNGSKFTFGVGNPSGVLSGNSGDLYFDFRTNVIWQSVGGVFWIKQVPLQRTMIGPGGTTDEQLTTTESTYLGGMSQRPDSWSVGNTFDFHLTGNIGAIASVTVRVRIGPNNDNTDPIALEWTSPVALGALDISGQFTVQAVGAAAKVRGICTTICGLVASANSITANNTFDSTVNTFVGVNIFASVNNGTLNKIISGKLTARDF